MDNVIIENGEEIVISDECAAIMEDENLIYSCTEEHPDDTAFFHLTERFAKVARYG